MVLISQVTGILLVSLLLKYTSRLERNRPFGYIVPSTKKVSANGSLGGGGGGCRARVCDPPVSSTITGKLSVDGGDYEYFDCY